MKLCPEYNLISHILHKSSWQSGPSLRANTKKKKKKLFTTHQFLAMKLDTPVFG